ncbi:thioesterase domain-containing protein [Streptomyces sp. SCSIO 30461]|uniref:thioesterase domain-containing protein n=1 Tax=Streptomyces sp. SCSIO 30461 TaxID=3118085 RepID=UPI0030D37D7B
MTDNLLTLRSGSGSTTVFVHTASGLATGFRRLAGHLGGHGTVLALENLEAGPPERCSVAALAADYWSQMEEHTDPLRLAGWSFGGPVAMEMATLAEQAGRTVEVVVLLDAATPALLASRTPSLLHEMAALFELAPGLLPPDTVAATVPEALHVVAEALRTLPATRGVTSEDLEPFAEVYAWHLRAARCGPRPRVPSAPVVLLRARDEPGWYDAPEDLGWSEVLGGPPETLWAPGTHHGLMAPGNVAALGAILTPLLTAASAGGSTPVPGGTP